MKVRFSISPATCILLFCMIATTPLSRLSACLLAAALHELGHIFAAKMLQIDLSSMKLDVLGARITMTGKLHSYLSVALLCLAGPLANLICLFLALPLAQHYGLMHEFCTSSLSLCVLNLIPIEGFDGGRILHGLLCKLLPLHAAERICSVLCFLCLLSLWMLSVWLLLRTGTSLSLFVFSCCLFGILFV